MDFFIKKKTHYNFLDNFDLILQNSKEQNGKFWNLKINFCEVIIKVKIHSTHTYWFFHHDSSSKRNELLLLLFLLLLLLLLLIFSFFVKYWFFHEKNVDFIDFFLLIFWGCCCYSCCCCCLLLVWFDFDFFFDYLLGFGLILILIFQPN